MIPPQQPRYRAEAEVLETFPDGTYVGQEIPEAPDGPDWIPEEWDGSPWITAGTFRASRTW